MARHDIHVLFQVALKRLDLRVLARCLPADDGALFRRCNRTRLSKSHVTGTIPDAGGDHDTHTGSVLGHHTVDGCRLNAVDDVVARPRHKVAIAKYSYIGLYGSSLSKDRTFVGHWKLNIHRVAPYLVRKFIAQCLVLVFFVAG